MPNWPHRHRTPLLEIASPGLRRSKRGNALRQATFLPSFLHCLLVCAEVQLRSFFFFLILGLGVSGCQMPEVDQPPESYSPSIAGLLTATTEEAGQIWHWVLGGGGYGPLLRYLHLVAHCQSDKGGHLVQTVHCQRLFTHLLWVGHCVLQYS